MAAHVSGKKMFCGPIMSALGKWLWASKYYNSNSSSKAFRFAESVGFLQVNGIERVFRNNWNDKVCLAILWVNKLTVLRTSNEQIGKRLWCAAAEHRILDMKQKHGVLHTLGGIIDKTYRGSNETMKQSQICHRYRLSHELMTILSELDCRSTWRYIVYTQSDWIIPRCECCHSIAFVPSTPAILPRRIDELEWTA